MPWEVGHQVTYQGAGRQYRRPPDAMATPCHRGCRRTKLGEGMPMGERAKRWGRMGPVGSVPWIWLELSDAAAGWRPGVRAASLNQSERRERVTSASGAGAGGFVFAAGTCSL